MNQNDSDNTKASSIFMSGTDVGHFKIIEKIGAGGMGEVYSANDTKLDRKVALKFLPIAMASDPGFRARFVREAKAAAQLNHASIVTIHDVSEHNNQPYFAMEYVDGAPLKDSIPSTEGFFARLNDLAIGICEGLQVAHDAGIIHRDIKPANIKVDKQGRPKILDFGLATLIGSEQVTKTGSTMGTVSYMSPEQVRGSSTDNRSDLFSLGIVLYELVAGKRPFERESDAAILNAILQDEPEPLTRYKSGVPEELERIITKLLEKIPNHRYQNASGVISDFRRLESRGSLMPSSEVGLQSHRKKLVVLPFQNMGHADDEYFADGITEEITSRLAAVRDLGVISRTSAMQYKNSDKKILEIGRELNVDYILEGTVRWSKSASGSRVRITPQLIEVLDDTHLWSDRYDRTLEDIFEVQSDIAERVIKQLNITLLEPEKEVIEAHPTDNMDAYNAYLKALEYLNRPSYLHANYLAAIQLLNSAVKYDPEFVLAYSRLSDAYTSIYFHGYDRSDLILEEAKKAMDKAFSLSPDFPGAYLAQASWYYHVDRDYSKALEALEKSAQAFPNDTNGLRFAVYRRQGKLKEAIKIGNRILELNPHDPRGWLEIGITNSLNWDFPTAERQMLKAEELSPGDANIQSHLMFLYLRWKGDLNNAKAALERCAVPGNQPDLDTWAAYYFFARKFDDLITFINLHSDTLIQNQIFYRPISFLFGSAHHFLGKPEEAKPFLLKASSELKDYLIDYPNDHRALATLGICCALLGDKQSALKFGKRAVDQMPVSKDLFLGGVRLNDLATIEATVGEVDSALEKIEDLLSHRGIETPWMMRLNPHYDCLKGNEQFNALLEKYDTTGNE